MPSRDINAMNEVWAPGRPPAPSQVPRTLRQRFGALRNLPQFLRLIWRTNWKLTLTDIVARLVRALLPVAALYVGKLIIDEVVHHVQGGSSHGTMADWLSGGPLHRLGILLLTEFVLAVLSDALGRVVSLVDTLLQEQFINATSMSLMRHAASLDLEDFEDSDVQDRLDRARRQIMGRSTLMQQLFNQAQDMVTILSFGVGLLVYAPWLILLLILALVPAFLGEAHFNAMTYSLDYSRTQERRELD